MAMHRIREGNTTHYLNDSEYRWHKFRGCLMNVFWAIVLLVVAVLWLAGKK